MLPQLRQQLFDLLITKNFNIVTRNTTGTQTSDPNDSDVFSFDYTVNGNNYGTVVIAVVDSKGLEIYYGDKLGKGMESSDRNKWYDFLSQIRHFAYRHQITFDLKNLDKLKYNMQSLNQVKESKYYGSNKISYADQPLKTRLKIIHSATLGKDSARFRNIAALYVENSKGERFKLPFTKLFAGRAMARHISEGGTPYDAFGQNICEMVSDLDILGKFIRSTQGKDWQDADAQGLVESAILHYKRLKNKVRGLIAKRGYLEQRETWQPGIERPHDMEITEKIRHMFTERLLDSRIEDALPVLHKLNYKDNDMGNMKEVTEFEQWANSIVDTPTLFQEEANPAIVDVTSKEDMPFTGPYQKKANVVVDKSGAKHTPMSIAKSLAHGAMQKIKLSNEELKGGQKKLDKNHNGKLDSQDFAMLRNGEIEEAESVSSIDQREYNYEGQMARAQLQTILRNSKDLIDMLTDRENMPEWVQSKITLSQNYISSVRDYLQSKKELSRALHNTFNFSEPSVAEGGDLDESHTPSHVIINGKQVDLGSVELDGVKSWDRPDYSDAYASAATFTDGTELTADELDELRDKHPDVINMKAHDMF